MLRFTIPGEAQAWQRVTKGRWHGKMVVPAETRAYEQTVAQYGQLAINQRRHQQIPGEVLAPFPQEGPFWLGAIFYLGTYRIKTAVHNFDGDLDNYIKSLKDGLQGIVWHNDKQVVGFLPGTHKELGHKHPQAHILIVHASEVPYEQLQAWRELPRLGTIKPRPTNV
jgi:Holliday junction resolvase RusA-like endonuclease